MDFAPLVTSRWGPSRLLWMLVVLLGLSPATTAGGEVTEASVLQKVSFVDEKGKELVAGDAMLASVLAHLKEQNADADAEFIVQQRGNQLVIGKLSDYAASGGLMEPPAARPRTPFPWQALQPRERLLDHLRSGLDPNQATYTYLEGHARAVASLPWGGQGRAEARRILARMRVHIGSLPAGSALAIEGAFQLSALEGLAGAPSALAHGRFLRTEIAAMERAEAALEHFLRLQSEVAAAATATAAAGDDDGDDDAGDDNGDDVDDGYVGREAIMRELRRARPAHSEAMLEIFYASVDKRGLGLATQAQLDHVLAGLGASATGAAEAGVAEADAAATGAGGGAAEAGAVVAAEAVEAVADTEAAAEAAIEASTTVVPRPPPPSVRRQVGFGSYSAEELAGSLRGRLGWLRSLEAKRGSTLVSALELCARFAFAAGPSPELALLAEVSIDAKVFEAEAEAVTPEVAGVNASSSALYLERLRLVAIAEDLVAQAEELELADEAEAKSAADAEADGGSSVEKENSAEFTAKQRARSKGVGCDDDVMLCEKGEGDDEEDDDDVAEAEDEEDGGGATSAFRPPPGGLLQLEDHIDARHVLRTMRRALGKGSGWVNAEVRRVGAALSAGSAGAPGTPSAGRAAAMLAVLSALDPCRSRALPPSGDWTLEWCHGDEVRQFARRDGANPGAAPAFSLGMFASVGPPGLATRHLFANGSSQGCGALRATAAASAAAADAGKRAAVKVGVASSVPLVPRARSATVELACCNPTGRAAEGMPLVQQARLVSAREQPLQRGGPCAYHLRACVPFACPSHPHFSWWASLGAAGGSSGGTAAAAAATAARMLTGGDPNAEPRQRYRPRRPQHRRFRCRRCRPPPPQLRRRWRRWRRRRLLGTRPGGWPRSRTTRSSWAGSRPTCAATSGASCEPRSGRAGWSPTAAGGCTSHATSRRPWTPPSPPALRRTCLLASHMRRRGRLSAAAGTFRSSTRAP